MKTQKATPLLVIVIAVLAAPMIQQHFRVSRAGNTLVADGSTPPPVKPPLA
jgi:hypothetical protein